MQVLFCYDYMPNKLSMFPLSINIIVIPREGVNTDQLILDSRLRGEWQQEYEIVYLVYTKLKIFTLNKVCLVYGVIPF
jgi:hypothetical protein